jgi:hypothetical protein
MAMSGGWSASHGIQAAIERVPPAPRSPTEAGEAAVFGWVGDRRLERRVGLVLLLVGLAVALPFTPGMVEEIQLIGATMDLTEGVVVDATALDFGRRRRGQGHRVEYEYEVVGEQHRATGYLRYALENPPRPGDPIEVSYAIRHPERSRPSGGSPTYIGLPTLGFWAFALVGFVLWGRSVRLRARTEQVWVSGVPVPGRIVARREKPLIGDRGSAGIGLSYTYAFEGSIYEAEASHHDVALAARAFPQDEVVVLVDPSSPTWSALWPEAS